MRGSKGSGGRAVVVAVGSRLLLGLVAVSAVAGLLALLDVTGFRVAWGWGAVAVGAFMGVTANDVMSRSAGFDTGTVFGGGMRHGPDPSRDTGEGLTGIGAFLLVGVPLAVAGVVVLSL